MTNHLRRRADGICLLGACLATVAGCAPEWSVGGATPVGVTAAAGAPTSSVDDPPLDPLARYAATPLGTRVRSKRISVLFVNVADMAIYDFRAPERSVVLSSVMRSYTSFKDKSLADVAEYLDSVKVGYETDGPEIDAVYRFIEQAVEPVDYYRIDVRYEVGAPEGAVLVYEFKPGEQDRPLASRLIQAPAALGAIHFADVDGYDTPRDETVLAEQYVVQSRNGKLGFVRRAAAVKAPSPSPPTQPTKP